MQIALVTAISLHALAGVFWAGTTFTLARSGGSGAESLFRPQMGAATLVVLTGVYLWLQLHEGPLSMTEHVLGIGILAALIAAGVQGAIGGRALWSLRNGAASESDARSKVALAQRIAALLLAVTVICMVAARYA